jgi:predicted amidohydrolase YtcJ
MRVLLLCLMILLAASAISQTQVADVIFVNGKIWTVDKAKPSAEAVAVLDGRVLAIGSGNEIRKLAGAQTRIVDLKGKRMLPGFIDNHTHFMSGGFQLQSVDLRYTKSEAGREAPQSLDNGGRLGSR